MLSSTAASAAIPSFVVPAAICAATPGCVEVVSNVVEMVMDMCSDDEEDSPYPPGQKCKFVGERHWPSAKTKTCIYQCPGWPSPVTFQQAAGHACPGIKPNGEVDESQLVRP